MRESKGILKKIGRYMERPSRLLDWLQISLIGVYLLALISQIGGNYSHGIGFVHGSVLLFMLSGAHALFWVVRKDRPAINLYSLLPLPFIVYAAVHYFLGPTSFAASISFWGSLQAFILYYVIINSVRSQKDAFRLLGVLVIVLGWSCAHIFFFHVPLNGSEPLLATNLKSPVSEGIGGLFYAPERMGAFACLMLPVLTLCCIMKRFPGPVRILMGGLAVTTLVCLILTISKGAIFSIACLFLLLPILVLQKWRNRIRLWVYGFLGTLFVLPLLWSYSSALRPGMAVLFEPDNPSFLANLPSLLSLISGAAFLGVGPGNYVEAAIRFGVPASEGLSSQPFGSIWFHLSELGVLGIGLALAPCIFLLYKASSIWAALPYKKLTVDEEKRLMKAGGRRARRAKLKSLGKAPSSKVLLGGFATGIFAFLVFNLFENPFESSFILSIYAVFLALIASQLPSKRFNLPKFRWLCLIFALVPPAVCALGLRHMVTQSYGANNALVAEQALDAIEGDGDLLFQEPGRLYLVEILFELAIQLNPNSAPAHAGLGRAILARLDTGLYEEDQVGSLSYNALYQAYKLNPDSWRIHFDIARSLIAQSEDSSRVEDYLNRSIELGPQEAEPLLLKGQLLYEERRYVEAIQHVERAVQMDPMNKEAKRLYDLLLLHQF